MAQAKRLRNLDDRLCSRVLDDLVADGFLRRTDQGLYVRVSPERQFAVSDAGAPRLRWRCGDGDSVRLSAHRPPLDEPLA